MRVAPESDRETIERIHPNAEIDLLDEFVEEYGFDAGSENQHRKQSLRGRLENFGELLDDIDGEGGRL